MHRSRRLTNCSILVCNIYKAYPNICVMQEMTELHLLLISRIFMGLDVVMPRMMRRDINIGHRGFVCWLAANHNVKKRRCTLYSRDDTENNWNEQLIEHLCVTTFSTSVGTHPKLLVEDVFCSFISEALLQSCRLICKHSWFHKILIFTSVLVPFPVVQISRRRCTLGLLRLCIFDMHRTYVYNRRSLWLCLYNFVLHKWKRKDFFNAVMVC